MENHGRVRTTTVSRSRWRVKMKDKIITIKPKGITQKQWVNFLLELNLMKKAWKPYGVDVEIKAPGIKKTLLWGTKIGGQISDQN